MSPFWRKGCSWCVLCHPGTIDNPDQLRPATPDEIADVIAFGLRFDGRRLTRRHDVGLGDG